MQYFTALILFFLFSCTAQAQVYKWVDQDGNVQYSSQPPSTGAAQSEKKLNIKVTPASPVNSKKKVSNSLTEEMEAFNKRQQKKQEEAAKQQAEAGIKNKKCIYAKGKLRTYRDSARLTIPDGSGGIKYVDDDLRQKKIKEAKKDIAAFCR